MFHSARFARNRSRGARRAAQAGFTLVEVLVVISIIGLIMGLVGPRVLNYLSDAKVKAARIQIESLSSALDLYFLDVGRYPSSTEGLAALMQRPSSASAWNGPYLKGATVPKDPWGTPYAYKSPGDRKPYDIMSFGPDGPNGAKGAAGYIKNGE